MKTRIKMNDKGVTKITSVIILIASILMGTIAASVVMGETNGSSPEDDLAELTEQTLDDALNEILPYIQIKERYGKYYGEPQQQKINKIAFGIKELVSVNINLAYLNIILNDGENIVILENSGIIEIFGSNSLFAHPIWDTIPDNTYGLIVTHDNDNSIIDYNTINENTDRIYIVFKLPNTPINMEMSNGDSIIVKLVPLTGNSRTIELKAPLPMKSIVIFD